MKEKTIENKEIVRYNSDLNTKVFLKNFNALNLNTFITLVALAREKGLETIVIPFAMLKKAMLYTSNNEENFIKVLRETNRKILNSVCEIETDERIEQFVFFTSFVISKKNRTLTIKVNEDYMYILNDFNRFTEFGLNNFIKLNSKYVKILYKELMQFKKTGKMFLKMEDFRKKLDIPSTLNFAKIKERILLPSVQEFSLLFKKFKIVVTYNNGDEVEITENMADKRGDKRKVTNINFYFSTQKEDLIEVAEEVIKEKIENKATEITEEESNAKQEIDRIDLQIIIYKNALDSLKEIEITEELQERLDFFNKEILKLEQEKEKVRKLAEKFDEKIEKMIETQENTSDIVNKINEFCNYWQLTNKHKEILLSLTNKFSSEEIEKELERIEAETNNRAEIDRLKYVKTCVNNADTEIAKRLKKAEKKAKEVAVAEAEVEVVEKITENEVIGELDNFLGKYKI